MIFKKHTFPPRRWSRVVLSRGRLCFRRCRA